DEEGRDLDDIDYHIDRSGACNSPVGYICNTKSEHNAEDPHKQRAIIGAAEGVGPKLIQQPSAKDCCDSDHDTRVYPVIKVARPSGDELGESGELVCVRL